MADPLYILGDLVTIDGENLLFETGGGLGTGNPLYLLGELVTLDGENLLFGMDGPEGSVGMDVDLQGLGVSVESGSLIARARWVPVSDGPSGGWAPIVT